MRTDYTIFIITHGRPDSQLTLNLLQKYGYTGSYYLVLDDQDTTVQSYIDNYGSKNIIIYDKNHYVSIADFGLREPEYKFPLYARMAIEDIAVDLGYKYFMVFDDDFTNIRIRYDVNGSLKSRSLNGIINDVFDATIDFMESTNIACASFGFSNTYRSGVSAIYNWSSRNRMCAESFIRNSDYKVNWRPLMIHDLLTSLDCNRYGQVWMQLPQIQVEIKMSEGKISGGSTELYRKFDKFKRVFFPTMLYPDCNYPRFLNNKWITTLKSEYACNKIIGERYKK